VLPSDKALKSGGTYTLKLEYWSIETIVLKFQKVLLGPSLQYSITPIINNVLWTTDDPIDKEMQFKAVHSIPRLLRFL
jgi:hypothetical protein